MAALGMLGTSPHANGAHAQLEQKPELRWLFTELEADVPTKNSRSGFAVPGYSTSLRLFPCVAGTARKYALQSNIEMAKWLRENVEPKSASAY
jgi:hypothetical protein